MLPGGGDYTLLQLVGEVGTDLRAWPSEKHFTAWLGLAPGSKQSGKRKGSQQRARNRAGRLFCVIARSVDKALGGFYRRLKMRRGGLVGNLALARNLAAFFWRLMVHGMNSVEEGLKKYETRVAHTEQWLLQKLARKHGLTLTAQGHRLTAGSWVATTGQSPRIGTMNPVAADVRRRIGPVAPRIRLVTSSATRFRERGFVRRGAGA